MLVAFEFKGPGESLQCWIFEKGLIREHPFKLNIGRKKAKTIQEMLTMLEPYMLLEEKLNMHFENPALVETHSSLSAGKEFHRRQGELNHGIQERYAKYTHLTVTCEKIYQDSANNEFLKGRVCHHYPVREASHLNKSKYCLFHENHNHNINDCIQLKVIIKWMIKNGRLTEYVK